MKISNSKKQLAKIIHENGGWRELAESAAQCAGGEISFWHDTATKRHGEDWRGSYLGRCDDIEFTGVKLPNWHQTILSRDEYFHLYPVAEAAPDADGWIEWKGGECPVEDDAIIDIRFRDGYEERGVDADWYWEHSGGGDIIAYRLHKPEQECATNKLSSEAVSAAKIALMGNSIEELVRKPTIEQLADDYRNRKDYADSKRQEADAAKADADEALRKMELAGEAIGFMVTLITAKQESELVSEVKVGDEVECVESNVYREKYRGMIGTVLEVDDSSTPYLVDFGEEKRIWCHEVRFIRRP